MAPALRNKAHALEYDVIQGKQSHAEGQLIQFLLDRHRKRPGWYTHILGLGCSRPICAECDHLFKLFLGEDYQQVISSIYDRKGEITLNKSMIDNHVSYPESTPSDVISSSFEPMHDKRIKVRVPGTVLKSRAINSTQAYDNYYMPEDLQQAVRYLANKVIKFSENRFNKRDAGDSRKSRKRN